jgi:DNA helicase HerA-like ATPase
VVGEPNTLTARKAYQTKLAEMRIEGELLPNGSRLIGAARTPDVMTPVTRITDDELERFATSPDGNLRLGNLRSGGRRLRRVARIPHNFSGERMLVLGMPGKGKSQLVRSILSQVMEADENEDDAGGPVFSDSGDDPWNDAPEGDDGDETIPF